MREAYPALKKRFARAKVKLHLVSAASRDGLDPLVAELWSMVQAQREGSEEAG